MRTESRGGHTREDYPGDGPGVAQGEPRLLGSTASRSSVDVHQQPLPAMPARPARSCSTATSSAKYFTDRRAAPAATPPPDSEEDALMSYDAQVPGLARRRRRRRAAGLHRRGQRGRGRPRHHPPAAGHPGRRPGRPLELQGRQVRLVQRRDQRPAAADVHDPDDAPSTEDETITVTPMRAFPVIRDLVTDVSFNYEKARADPGVRAARRPRARRVPDGAGRRRALARSSASASSASCARTPATSSATTRRTRRRSPARGSSCGIAELDMHPLDTRSDRQASRAGGARASASATSPSAAPRSAPSTSRSPTTRSSR